MENKKYNIELEVLTPLSVGAGGEKDWQPGADYVVKDGKVYVLNLQKAAEKGIDMERLSTCFLKNDQKGILSLIGNLLPDVSDHVFTLPASTTNPIKTFLRSQFYDRPLVAGSSIKGSIRSALFNYLSAEERAESLDDFKEKDVDKEGRKGHLNEYVFGEMKDGTDFMRFIQVGDVEMPSTILVNTKIFNLRKEGRDLYGGWKHKTDNTTNMFIPEGFNTLYECVPPGENGLGAIVFARKPFEIMLNKGNVGASVYNKEKKQALMDGGITTLFHIINQATTNYLQKEKAFFEKYSEETDRSEEIKANIDFLLQQIPSDNSSCILKMSAGVGFHSITGDWKYPDYDDTSYWTLQEDKRNAGKKKYKSRKVADYKRRLQLMGFVRMSILSDAEANEFDDYMRQEHQEIMGKRIAVIRQEEAARIQAIEAERQREEAFRLRNHYEELIHVAQDMLKENRWQDALDQATEAMNLIPNGKHHAAIMEESRKGLERVKTQQQLEQLASADAEKFSRSLADVLKNGTSFAQVIGSTGKWLKNGEGRFFGEPEFQILVTALRKFNVNERKLSGKRKELIKAIGEEWANRVFEEISN